MTTVLLVRHGLTDANLGGTLAGWTPGVHLAAKGEEQVRDLAVRLAPVPVTAIVSSPLERCQETAASLAAGRDNLAVATDERLGECHYGDWQGQPLKTLAKDPLWKVVQAHPSAVVFPGDGGESLAAAQLRAVRAVRDWNERLGPEAGYAVCSHGDIIKAIVADALGLHLDQFQRIQVDPASLTVIRYTELRPFLVRLNDGGTDLSGLVPVKQGDSDAPVGGGA